MDAVQELRVLSGICNRPQWTLCPAADVGSNISLTGTEKAQIQRDRDIRPGTDAWFRLWFSKPYLTGERPV